MKEISKKDNKIHPIQGKNLKEGWAGKVWAQHQAMKLVEKKFSKSKYILFTDADILHSPNNLNNLVSKAESENLDLVSLMVLLRAKKIWEKILMPAFVFFFQKLYPFQWVNNPKKKIAAAAGGCMLVKYSKLKKSGGIKKIKGQIIDDCALAKVLKKNGVEVQHAYPGCCGMPFLEQADLNKVVYQAKKVSKELLEWIEKGYKVVTLTASCGLMLKLEWPLLLTKNNNIKKLSQNVF